MRILYFSSYHCHLEAMELQLFHELGIKFLSTGKFLNPRVPRFDSMHEPLDIDVDVELLKEYLKYNPIQKIWTTPNMTRKLVDKFDMVYLGYCGPHPFYFKEVWPLIKHKPVIIRTYGLQHAVHEMAVIQAKQENKQVYTVRFSEKENMIANHADTDAVILPYVDEDKYKDWNGLEKSVFTAQNWYKHRYSHEPYNIYENIVKDYNPRLHGLVTPGGVLSQEEQRAMFRNSRVYFSLGTRPSPITINIFEALMTGTPTVTWGMKFGADPQLPMYQIPEMITNWKNGLASDDPHELKDFIQKCMDNYDFAKDISLNARKLAASTFGKKVIKEQWRAFFKKIGYDL